MAQKVTGNRSKAIWATIILHLLLAAVLILGIEFSDYRPLSGPRVEVRRAQVVPTPAKPRPDPELERRKREQEAEEARRKAAEEEQVHRREQELEVQRKAEVELKRKQAKQAAQEKAKQEAEKKAEEAAKKKVEQAAKKQAEETEKRRKVEDEARRRAEAEQQAREQALQDALAQEQHERELSPLRNAYSAAISRKIAQNWLKPPSISDDLKCEVMVTQTPDGAVTGARITRSSGNAVFDESVVKAIYKAAPLPQPPSLDVFDRELEIAFCSTGEVC